MITVLVQSCEGPRRASPAMIAVARPLFVLDAAASSLAMLTMLGLPSFRLGQHGCQLKGRGAAVWRIARSCRHRSRAGRSRRTGSRSPAGCYRAADPAGEGCPETAGGGCHAPPEQGPGG